MADIVVASRMATILGAAQIGGVYQIEQDNKRLCTLLEATNHGCVYSGLENPPQNQIVRLISLKQKPYIKVDRSYISVYQQILY